VVYLLKGNTENQKNCVAAKLGIQYQVSPNKKIMATN
jgi:hypothetical protein